MILKELRNIVLLQESEKVNISRDIVQKMTWLLENNDFRKVGKLILAKTCDKSNDFRSQPRGGVIQPSRSNSRPGESEVRLI